MKPRIMFINRDKPAAGKNTLCATSDRRTIQTIKDMKRTCPAWFDRAVILLSDVDHIDAEV